MSKLCIISSYNDLCGIASYTKSLEKGFHDEGISADIINIDQEIFHSNMDLNRKEAELIISKICNDIDKYDYINIQFEFGIFGENLRDISNRIFKILYKCKNKKIVVTYHTIPYTNNILEYFQLLLSGKFKKLFSSIKLSEIIKKIILKKITKFVVDNKGYIVVHTERDKRLIMNMYGKKTNHIVSFPLCFHVQSNELDVNFLTNFRRRMKINGNTKIIGTFGFISQYKGFLTAVKSLNYLDKNYVLCIFGGQHPSSIKNEPAGLEYTKKIIDFINKMKLNNRVLFCGSIQDENEFSEYIKICDYIVLPYHEVHQSSSGVASLSIALNKSVYLSRTLAFMELEKYFRNSFSFFDIENDMELAQKIRSNDHIKNTGRFNALATYNIKANINFYKSCFEM